MHPSTKMGKCVSMQSLISATTKAENIILFDSKLKGEKKQHKKTLISYPKYHNYLNKSQTHENMCTFIENKF